jgi:hypothetical protein
MPDDQLNPQPVPPGRAKIDLGELTEASNCNG